MYDLILFLFILIFLLYFIKIKHYLIHRIQYILTINRTKTRKITLKIKNP